MTVSSQAPASHTYDVNARLRTFTQAQPKPVALDYDATNRRLFLTLPNGMSTKYAYDAASPVTALISRNALGPLRDLTSHCDGPGNRISIGGIIRRNKGVDVTNRGENG